jgi:hypothetical protein
MTETLLERLFYSVATRHLDEQEIANYRASVEKHELLSTASAFPSIDAKATGLLTHVSMMIAGLGLVAPLVAQSDLELGVIITEMAVYLLIAIGTLRCLSVFAGHELRSEGADLDRKFVRELVIRRELFVLCHRASIILTMIVFVLLPIQFFYAPVK